LHKTCVFSSPCTTKGVDPARVQGSGPLQKLYSEEWEGRVEEGEWCGREGRRRERRRRERVGRERVGREKAVKGEDGEEKGERERVAEGS